MMKKILSLLFACLPITMTAQSEGQYLEGAVPIVDGKVIFSTEMSIESMSKEQIYTTLLDWSNQRFQPDEKFNDRVLFQDKEKGKIVVNGEEYIVFSTSALALDRTRIYYHLYITCEEGKCKLDFSRIRYWYDENGSLIYGFDKLIEAKTGIATRVADDAISCVAYGTGKSLDSINAMQDGTMNLSRKRQMF